jgi:hypothetical protein
MAIRERYEVLKKKVVTREREFNEFISMLETKTSWLTSPASTRFHLNREGGLLEHSVGVCETLLRLRDMLASGISEESCVIVGLLHDAGKVGMPGVPRYLKNDNQWEVEKRNMAYKINPQETYLNLAARSLYLIGKYIPLSDAEAQAILYHDGQYVDANKEVAHQETPLTLLLQFADNWHASVLEAGKQAKDGGTYYQK